MHNPGDNHRQEPEHSQGMNQAFGELRKKHSRPSLQHSLKPNSPFRSGGFFITSIRWVMMRAMAA